MSSPIFVNGSTTVISVKSTDFTYDGGRTAVVHLSSVNSFGRMITIFDEDGFLGTGGKKIRVSTTKDVFLDSGKNQDPNITGGDWYIDLTTRNASISVFPRKLKEWVLPQTVITGGLTNINNNVVLSGTNFNANRAQLISISTNLLVYGSTISATEFTTLAPVRTSLVGDSLTVPALRALETSTANMTVATIVVPSIVSLELNSYGIGDTNSVQTSTFSSMQTSMSTLQTRTLGIIDTISGNPPSYLMNSNGSTFWNQQLIPKETNIIFSTSLSIYSTTLPLFDINQGISSLSTIIPGSVSSFDGSVGFSSYSTAFIEYVQSINYGPGVSSLSTTVSIGLSSLITVPAISTLSTTISRGLSTVITSPGISSLNLRFSNMISTLASGPGLSSLSTSVSLGLSTVNATLAFSNVSTIYSFGISDIAVHTGLSSLSTPIGSIFSSLYAGDGISSLSSFVYSSLSSLFVAPGISSINQTAIAYYSNLNSPAGISSLSSVMSSLSTYSVSQGLSSLSTVFSLGISTVSVRGGLSSISTTFAAGFFNVAGAQGASSMSTIVPLVLSSLNTSQGASSLFQFIKNQFSTNSDQQGISSLSSVISSNLSSVVEVGSASFNFPAILTTQIIETSSVQLLDSTMSYNVGRNIYSTLFLSANVLYIGLDPLDKFVVQSTSRSVISVSSFYANIGGLVSTASLVGTSLRIDNTRNFGISSFVSTVSTQQFVTSSFITSSITFTGVSPRPLSLYLSNTDVLFNESTFSEFVAWGASSLSTTIFSGISSFSNIMILQTSSASTSVSLGLSTLNFGPGLSTLSSLISQASTVNFFPGISTRTINVSTGLICTISSFGNISSFLLVNNRLVTSTLLASTIFASNATIGILNLPRSYISSFKFVRNTAIPICSLSTFVTGSGISAGNITIFASNVSSFTSNLFVNRESFFSSFAVSTLFLPNLYTTSGPAYAPLFLSANNTLWFNGSNIANAGDPNNLSLFMTILSSPGLYASTILTSSLNTSPFIKTDRIATFESVEITQSTNSMWNRTIYRETVDGKNDVVQWSYNGLTWNDTNWNETTRFGEDQFFTKPSYNGVYWLIGNVIQCNDTLPNYSNSVLYSPNGLSYYALENGQFYSQCTNPTWNGQYWLAGDGIDGFPNRTIRRSFDGLIWQQATTGGFFANGNNFTWNGYMWVGVGGISNDLNTTSCNVQYSYDGLNWYNCSGEMPEERAQSVCWNGTLWVVGGQYQNAFTYSYNGINWSLGNYPGTTSYSNKVNDIRWNGKIFVAVGQFSNENLLQPFLGPSGYGILNSLDGITWNPILTSGDILLWNGCGVDWNGEKWVACGCNFTDPTINYAYSYDGQNWTLGPSALESGTSNFGQRIGFSSNPLPAIETTTLSIHTAAYGYIPMYLTSTNQWQVLPSSIIMNNNFVINKEPNTDRRVGIKTLFPQCTLDINGTMQTNSSTFFSSIVIGSSINFNPRFEFTVIGSTFTNHLTINTPQSLSRSGPLDVWSPGRPIMYRQSLGTDISTITSTLSILPQTTCFPIVGGSNLPDSNSIYWIWNNGPADAGTSATYYEKLSGTAISFTGQHAVYVSSTSITQSNISSYTGLIVASADQGYLSYNINNNPVTGSNAIASTEALPIVNLTTEDMQQGVFGVLSDMPNSELIVNSSCIINAYSNPPGFRNTLNGRLLVNSLGDGALWVTNINGNINSGDYLCSCSIPGHARKQDDNGMYNYTVAKATMSCDFDVESSNYRCETIEWNASSFFRAFVGVTYHCG